MLYKIININSSNNKLNILFIFQFWDILYRKKKKNKKWKVNCRWYNNSQDEPFNAKWNILFDNYGYKTIH